ncbi:MAG: hypothetical protein UV60_C0006G0039 [Parcubacteria group bacterium GW2011_GWA2_43_11]|nr:MAG: hypothetical protein UU89_C0005G0006 [Parcubacteria group bacterium GW2011_GWC2_42_11]KKS85687.1 MAG: hypothetical protein UV60_C0006G0039 [Parcubacteria group bacterium GW2011_GWA2_43_11]
MATGIIPPNTVLSKEAEYRKKMYTESYSRLQHFAWRALNVHKKSNTELVVVCIQVKSKWKPLVDFLMPGYDWEANHATNVELTAKGIAGWGICNIVAGMSPNIADAATKEPTEGHFKVFVLADGGVTIYEIEPKEHA